jgi:hypothetical protein
VRVDTEDTGVSWTDLRGTARDLRAFFQAQLVDGFTVERQLPGLLFHCSFLSGSFWLNAVRRSLKGNRGAMPGQISGIRLNPNKTMTYLKRSPAFPARWGGSGLGAPTTVMVGVP